jgi:signal transduction histidine kinase
VGKGGESGLQASSDLISSASERLLRWRWPIMMLVGLFNIAVETVELYPETFGNHGIYYFVEILLFGLVGPMLGGFALTLLMHARARQRRADHHRSLLNELSALLADVREWDEILELVVRYPRRVIDLRGSCLLVYHHAHSRYHLESQWWTPDEEAPADLGSLVVSLPIHDAPSGRPLEDARSEDEESALGNRYALALTHGDRPVALLYLFLQPGVSLAEDQVRTLQDMAASMAIAIHHAQPQRLAMMQAQGADAERRRIARDLHDTLGQSISYIRLKLDQLTGDEALHEIGAIRQELEQMRVVAGDAYRQVRTTLSDLQAAPSSDLESALHEATQAAARRAGFQIEAVDEGASLPLPESTQRQIVYLLGEALNNVEKHAAASHIQLQTCWKKDRLWIRLSDDGRGFDTSVPQAPGHFGLATMQQRALSIGGQLTIASYPGAGTEVCLSLPIERSAVLGGEL